MNALIGIGILVLGVAMLIVLAMVVGTALAASDRSGPGRHV